MDSFISQCNNWAEKGTPFFFLVDFECKKPVIIRMDEAAAHGIFFNVNGIENSVDEGPSSHNNLLFEAQPVTEEVYNTAFQYVKKNILHGNSYLLNLTFPTVLDTNLDLEEIFQRSQSIYKLLKSNEFVVFSPECFIRIEDDQIFSYPMKGTIDASIPGAEQELRNNEKELWEHNTIVDLIRNDLSMVSKDVELTKYRYVDRIRTHKGELLQVSSEIKGRLPRTWKSNLGDILATLLPAGSISGAPKQKTLEIIRESELNERGYFTGIFGIFDGVSLDSAVMIRYIERVGNGLQFRSGGGITGHSDMMTEYKELIDKVYVPIT
ncbi:aminodeoxychorismate synthase component I [Bacteroidota bacterium]